MKRTGPGILIIAAVLGAGVGFVMNQLLTAAGRATYLPTLSLPALLVVVAGAVVVLALPVRRATRGRTAVPVNPFRALRVAMLAKAASIVGAAVGGLAAGLAAFVLTRPSGPSLGSMGTIIATAVCGAVLVAAALVAEHFCIIRKDDDDEPPGPGAAGDHLGH